MICKFFRGGRTYSGAKSAVAYLLNERVQEGQAKVLVGNPDITLNIIKTIKNKWKFSSGVMSFEELLDDKTKKEIIEEFKRVFFAGLEQDQYNLLVVEHSDKGRTELHFIIPRIELRTGKAYNPYFVKRDFAKKDLFQDYINAKFGLTSPHIAQKQNLTKQPNPNWKKNELQEWIDNYITENIEQGLIQNSEDVRYFLEQAGFKVTRQGKDYVGLEYEGKKVRMKGAIYGKNFTSVGKLAENAEARARAHRGATQAEFREIEHRLDEIVERQAKYNRKKYKQADRGGVERADRGVEREVEQDNKNSFFCAIWSDTNVFNHSYSNRNNYVSAEEQNRGDLQEQLHTTEAGMGIRKKRQSGVLRQNVKKRRVNDHRIGTTLNKVIRAGEARARKREERISRYAKRTERTNREAKRIADTGISAVAELERAAARRKERIRRIREIREAIKRNADRVKELAMQELEKFKKEVNIAEVAQLFGYYVDKEKSSRSVKQLRNDQTGDKIVVSRNKENGHYIYFSMQDNSDNGTIIDFLQRHTGKNLGEVRKYLRKWLKGQIEGKYEPISIQKSNADRNKIYRIWEKIENDKYFVGSWRAISGDIWEEIAEKNRIKIQGDTIYFPMYDLGGICGIEKRTIANGEKRIIQGSKKGLWSYGNLQKAKEIVIAESPLDAISYKLLNGEENIYLLATMGQIGEKQKEILRAVLERAKEKEIVIATDNDIAGELLAQEIVEISKEVGATKLYRAAPEKSKDWNEELQRVNKCRSHHSYEMSL